MNEQMINDIDLFPTNEMERQRQRGRKREQKEEKKMNRMDRISYLHKRQKEAAHSFFITMHSLIVKDVCPV